MAPNKPRSRRVLDGTAPISPADGKKLRREMRAEVKTLRAELRAMVEEYVDQLPFIRLGDLRSELPAMTRTAIKDLRPSQSELYARKLKR